MPDTSEVERLVEAGRFRDRRRPPAEPYSGTPWRSSGRRGGRVPSASGRDREREFRAADHLADAAREQADSRSRRPPNRMMSRRPSPRSGTCPSLSPTGRFVCRDSPGSARSWLSWDSPTGQAWLWQRAKEPRPASTCRATSATSWRSSTGSRRPGRISHMRCRPHLWDGGLRTRDSGLRAQDLGRKARRIGRASQVYEEITRSKS